MQRVAMLERSVKSASGSRAGCTYTTSPTASQPRAVWRAPERVVTAEQAESTHTLARSRLSDVRPIREAPARLGL